MNITGGTGVGGLVGQTKISTVNNCYSTGSVNGNGGSVGGLVGSNIESSNSQITNCYSTCSVTGSSYVGGLIGYNNSANVNKCYSTGNVSGVHETVGSVGGLIGYCDNSTVSNCYSTGNVTATGRSAGGLIGQAGESSIITNCYSRGSASAGQGYAAGLIGADGNIITNCYSTGSVVDGYKCGGLRGGYEGETINDCFWDINTSGMTYSTAGTGKTTSEMKNQSTFTNWDFTINGEDNDWRISSVNDGYPHLVWAESVDASLPVTLTNFSAQAVSGGVLLSWTTESETENLGFIIERKIVGAIHESPSSWSQIASYVTDEALAGHGSTSEKHEYQYTDKAVQPGATYVYRLADVDYSGKVKWHKEVKIKVEAGQSQMPAQFALLTAYPNPFNPAVMLRYHLSESCNTVLRILDLEGRMIETLVNSYQPVGTYSLVWRPVNQSAGIYILQLQAGKSTQTRKILYIK